jgi:hypothetical protein
VKEKMEVGEVYTERSRSVVAFSSRPNRTIRSGGCFFLTFTVSFCRSGESKERKKHIRNGKYID